MSNWLSDSIDVNGGRIHYTRTGGNKPALVLVHGFSDNGRCWTPVARLLEADYDVVMIDAQGHGLSSLPQPGYSHWDDIAGVITGLGLNRPHVMGHSMGAYATVNFAARYPQLVRSVILEDPPYFEQGTFRPARDEGSMPEWLAGLKGKTREELIAIAHRDNPGWSDVENEYWAESKMQFNPGFVKVKPAPDLGTWQELALQIQCPALLITGDVKRGALVSPEVARQMMDLMPRGHHDHIDGAGHCIRRDQFTAFMQAVRAFLV